MSRPILAVEGLSRRYGGVRALEGVSFTVGAGEVVGIIGPNGSGKTTLVNCISGFVRPTGGRVRFRERDITGWPAHRVADAGVVRTFQIMRPFHSLPAYQSLVVALTSARARRGGHGRHGDRHLVALDLLEELGFDRDSRIGGQSAGTLPTGHVRRLELGRCVALRPELILCDEVLSGLSVSETGSLLPLLERLRRGGMTLIMVEHRLRELFRLADRIVVLAEGRKLAEGPPREVLERPEVRAAYLGYEEAAP